MTARRQIEEVDAVCVFAFTREAAADFDRLMLAAELASIEADLREAEWRSLSVALGYAGKPWPDDAAEAADLFVALERIGWHIAGPGANGDDGELAPEDPPPEENP